MSAPRAQIAESGAAFPSTGTGARRCSVPWRASPTGRSVSLCNGQARRVHHRPHRERCWSGDKANPGALYDPGLFRRAILPRLAPVKLTEIAEAAGCSKASASDIRRGKWTPHVSTLGALAELVEIKLVADAVRQTTLPRVDRL